MSANGEIYFDGFKVLDMSNDLYKWLFKNSDQRTFTRKPSDRLGLYNCPLPINIRNGTPTVDEKEEDPQADEEEEEEEVAYIFEVSVATMIKRLEVHGFTLDATKRDFEQCINAVTEHFRLQEEMFGEPSPYHLIRRAAFSMPFEKWQTAIKEIFSKKLREFRGMKYSHDYQRAGNDDLINYMLNAQYIDENDYRSFFALSLGYVTSDFSYFARAVLEVLDKNASIILDATNLVSGGWYDGFDLLEDIQRPNTIYYNSLSGSLRDLRSLLEIEIDPIKRELLARLLYANAITAMETYLSDTLIDTVKKFPALVRRVVENEKEFIQDKISVSKIFQRHETINEEVINYLQRILYHKLPEVSRIYKAVLLIDLPKDIAKLIRAVNIRHGIVHRNGKEADGTIHNISITHVEALATAIDELALSIEPQIKEIYIEMHNAEGDEEPSEL